MLEPCPGAFPVVWLPVVSTISSLVVLSAADISRVIDGRSLDVIGHVWPGAWSPRRSTSRSTPGRRTAGESVAHNLCVPTVTVTLAIPLLGIGSVTVPVNVGVLLLATCPSMVTMGFPVSTIN